MPAEEVIGELDDFLKPKPRIDYLTFSGSGEPTLHKGIGRIIRHLKRKHPSYRIAVLTNGSLFYRKKVRDDVMRADLIIPSLDAVSDAAFRKISRPFRRLNNRKIISGLQALRKEFPGEIWLECFIIPGINDIGAEMKLLLSAFKRIKPDKIQLNTLDRPGSEVWVRPADRKKLESIVEFLKPLPAEIIAPFDGKNRCDGFDSDIPEKILATIKRRPCTARDLSDILGIHRNEINKYLGKFLSTGKIEGKKQARGTFFSTVKK